MTKIVWREWFNENAVKNLTAMGTLPRNEVDINTDLMDGEDVAAAVAADTLKNDLQAISDGDEIVIVEPELFAGTYKIDIDWDPTCYAHRSD